ncbi:gp16 family protein [Salipiger thiooxidans]|uniref:gp16 family protein n=1 Tax=Salipiger thiooxidans TaxID=282683 RepID=UPI001CD2E869|nr:regulatory protein GemA [Salipiger thiooxidans]MCA0849673.1 regulatory protein GemA [Salipiger thiooxidans]
MAASIRLIHVACRDLGIDQDTRRALQERLTGKASLRDMSQPELELVLGALKDQGFRPKGGRRPAAPRADLRLIHVLWAELGKAGELDKPGRDGLNAFIRRRFGQSWSFVPADVDMLRDWERIDDVIQALKAWADRAGIILDGEGKG